MNDNSSQSADIVRVVRAPGLDGDRLSCFRGERWVDLEHWLMLRAAPLDMRARLAEGWFGLARLRAALEDPAAPSAEPLALDGSVALLPPLLPREVGQILALGKNFRAHAAEFGEQVPASVSGIGELHTRIRRAHRELER